jgi:phosphotransferase system enzyme I (PtsI)
MNKQLKGVGASAGIAIGKVYLLNSPQFDIDDKPTNNPADEIKLYRQSIEATVNQLAKIKNVAIQKIGADKAEVFEAHIQIANDPEIKQEIENTINNTKVNGAFAIDFVFDKYYEMFKNMDDVYFKERTADVIDVKKRMLSNFLHLPLPDIASIDQEVVVVAHDLSPSETAVLDKKYVKGFITEIGGRTSHAAIMARTMEIPAVLGVNDILTQAKNDSYIGLDGVSGEVEIEPNDIDS